MSSKQFPHIHRPNWHRNQRPERPNGGRQVLEGLPNLLENFVKKLDIGFRKLLDDSVSRSHIHRPNWHMVYPVQSMSRSESFHPTSPFGAATNFNIQ